MCAGQQYMVIRYNGCWLPQIVLLDLLQVVGLGREDVPSVGIVHAPLAVMPTPFPRPSFIKAKRAATVFNKLIDRVSLDAQYLQSTLAAAAQFDDFTVSHSQVNALQL